MIRWFSCRTIYLFWSAFNFPIFLFFFFFLLLLLDFSCLVTGSISRFLALLAACLLLNCFNRLWGGWFLTTDFSIRDRCALFGNGILNSCFWGATATRFSGGGGSGIRLLATPTTFWFNLFLTQILNDSLNLNFVLLYLRVFILKKLARTRRFWLIFNIFLHVWRRPPVIAPAYGLIFIDSTG